MFSKIKNFVKKHKLLSRGLAGTSFILDKMGLPIASIAANAGGKIADLKGWGKKKRARKAKPKPKRKNRKNK